MDPTRNLLLVFFLVFVLNDIVRRRRVLLDKTETWMAVFSALLLASVFMKSNRVLFSLHVAGDAFIVPFLGYYITRRLISTEESFRRLTRVLGYTGFYVIILCLGERLMADVINYRVKGPFHDQGNLHMAMTAVFYALLSKEKQSLPPIVRRFVISLIPIVTILTLTRGNWVGFFSGVCAWGYLSRRLISSSKKIGAMGMAMVLGTVIGVGTLTLMPDDVWKERIGDEGTIDWRLLRWKVAIQEGINHPIVGSGLNNLRDALGKAGLNYSTVHNGFLSLLVELGILGLVAYLGIVKCIIELGWNLYRRGVDLRDRRRGIAIIAVMLAYQIPNFFSNDSYSYYLGALYIFVVAGGIAGRYSRESVVSHASKFATFRQRPSAIPVSSYHT